MATLAAQPAAFTATPRTLTLLYRGAAVAAVGFLIGLLFDPRAAWIGYLIGFALLTGLGLAGCLFVAVCHLTGARWAVVLRRLPEAMAGTLPVAALMGLGLLLGMSALYPWAGGHGTDHALAHKHGWLNGPMFALRLLACFSAWLWLAARLRRGSRAQDQDPAPRHARRSLWNSILFFVVFAVTWSVASVDWFQSLEPEWASTIYALVTVSGVITAGLAVVMIAAVRLRDRGPLRGAVRDDHLDDLGKIAIAVSLLWVYLWYCQYMLVWYTNLPEETQYFVVRRRGSLATLQYANVVLNWLIPFCALMPKAARRNGGVVLRVALVMLVGRCVDLYLLVAPPVLPAGSWLSPWLWLPVAGAACLFAARFLAALAQAPLLPRNDPDLVHSLRHRC